MSIQEISAYPEFLKRVSCFLLEIRAFYHVLVTFSHSFKSLRVFLTQSLSRGSEDGFASIRNVLALCFYCPISPAEMFGTALDSPLRGLVAPCPAPCPVFPGQGRGALVFGDATNWVSEGNRLPFPIFVFHHE